MNKYLIFRTDRVGDFLLTAILIKAIKRSDSSSYITVIASEKNIDYIKTFKMVDSVILLKKKIIEKFKLINNLKKDHYKAIIIHDEKKRSSFISLLLKTNNKITSNIHKHDSYIDNIKKILANLNFNFENSDLDILDNRKFNYFKNLTNDYIMLHFDEKWIHDEYIQNYTNIEPDKEQLIDFLNLLSNKTNKKIVITTGLKISNLLNDVFKNNFNSNILYIKNSSFLDIENIVHDCKLLISCHGAISHLAAAKNIKQIDIIEGKKSLFYKKWTEHFRNYQSLNRINFNSLAKDIINLI